jgi:wobble nucleotide-excising tRNase
MLKKIVSIENAGVYRSFQWNQSVLDPGNHRPDSFGAVNVLYGRNYSGKTTLSRIIHALEAKRIPTAVTGAAFVFEFDDNTIVNDQNLAGSPHVVRVFNEDFVRRNLALFHSEEGSIVPFAVLGAENNAIEAELAELAAELGTSDPPTGLRAKEHAHAEAVSQAWKHYSDSDKGLAGLLAAKSNKPPTGIKHNPLYREVNYQVPRLVADIDVVLGPSYSAPSEAEKEGFKQAASEQEKQALKTTLAPRVDIAGLLVAANSLLQRQVSPSVAIQSLLNDAVLQAWVRQGRELHERKRSSCAFCGNPISDDLWRRMDDHFNKESEELRQALQAILARVDAERTALRGWMNDPLQDFYSEFASEHASLIERRDRLVASHALACDGIEKGLRDRLLDVFTPLPSLAVQDPGNEIDRVHREFEALKLRSNEHAGNLDNARKTAVRALLLDEVYRFAIDIDYLSQVANVGQLKAAAEALEAGDTSLKSRIKAVSERMAALRAMLKDETRGAERVNALLANFFGHKALTLRSIESAGQYRFEIRRGSEQATHLSQGERGLVAFCYFVARLGDLETAAVKPLIWIDDPVSSLDGNHVFFLFSLIRYQILRAERYSQLFVSTHNLDFLKFAMELVPRGTGTKAKCFLIERIDDTSTIKLMPKYFREQVSEFVYLFHYIYRCAHAPTDANVEELMAGYANNARKFLEIYLSYRYPGPRESRARLASFFGENGVGPALLDRVHNEYSHLEGRFERALVPLDVPEVRQCARFILDTIESADKRQFDAFKEAIGEV